MYSIRKTTARARSSENWWAMLLCWEACCDYWRLYSLNPDVSKNQLHSGSALSSQHLCTTTPLDKNGSTRA